MTNITISIIIPTSGHRAPKMLARTLKSLTEEDIPKSLVDIIVVENGGNFGVKNVCLEFEKCLPIVYLYSDKASSSDARNIGINNSQSEFLVFFDDDIRLTGKTLQAYSSAFEKYGSNYFFGGPLDIDYEVRPDPNLIEFLPASAKGFDLGTRELELVTSKQLFLGGNQAFPRLSLIHNKGYDKLGTSGLNAGFIGEETRLQERFLQNGMTGVYIPNAKVWHYVPRESCTLDWLKARYFRRGLTEGVLLKSNNTKIKKILGIPRYLIIKLLINRSKFAIDIFNTNIRSKIAASLEYKVLVGQIIGFNKKL